MTCPGNPPSHLFLTNTGTLELPLVYCCVVYGVAQCLHSTAALEEQGGLSCSLWICWVCTFVQRLDLVTFVIQMQT